MNQPATSTEASTTEVLDVLMRLPAERGNTVVVVTHDEVVAATAHRRVHLTNGKLEPA